MANYDLNLFNSSYVTNYGDLTIAVNNASGGVFSALLLAAVWVFFFVSFKDSLDFGVQNFIVSSFITLIIAVIMFLGGYVVWQIVVIPFAMLMAGSMLYFYQR